VKNKIRLVNEVRADHGWEKDPALDAAQMAPPPAPVGLNAAQEPGTSDAKDGASPAAKLLKARARSRGY
jgi:hypothetical protein